MIRTRFAPSPTGPLHLGGARTALFSWLHARRNGGCFVLRMEDTDRQRSTSAFESSILEALEWLGLHADEGPFRQSERGTRYREAARLLLESGHAYYCRCTREELELMRARARQRKDKPRYDRSCREQCVSPAPGTPCVLRFRNPLEGELLVRDRVLGEIRCRNEELDDFIITRADGNPTYNFTVVVDDLDMGITEVIRGADHLNNTPRQMNVFQALGQEAPRYAHLPLILDADGTPLSKRRGARDLLSYRNQGYLPEALLNGLARLGWSHGDQELFTPEELVECFELERVQRAAARFDPEKLRHLNRQHLKRHPSTELAADLTARLQARGLEPSAGPNAEQLVETLRERISTLEELAAQAEIYYRDPTSHDPEAVTRFLDTAGLERLRALQPRLEALQDWQAPTLHQVLRETAVALETGLGKLAQPLRVVLCGRTASPPIDVTLSLVGREASLRRLRHALERGLPP